MSADFEQKIQILNIRKILVYDDEKEIINGIKSRKDYYRFLYQLNALENFELGFLLLEPKFIHKIQNILGVIRFKTTDEDVINAINTHIRSLNELVIVSVEKKNSYIKNYIEEQEEIHKIKIISQEEFPVFMANDYIVLCGLINKDLPTLDPVQLYSSVNYFLRVLPEFFKDKELKNYTIESLFRMKHQVKKPYEKQFLLKTAKEIYNLNKKN